MPTVIQQVMKRKNAREVPAPEMLEWRSLFDDTLVL
jgi:hypothetical protein